MNKIVNELRRRLNGRGIALPEAFFAFLILISLSLLLLNFFMPKTNNYINVKSFEADYDATLKATTLALAGNSTGLTGKKELFALTGYMPVIDYKNSNKMFLLNIVDMNDNLVPYSNKFEIINRYRFGPASAIITRNDVIGLREYTLSVTTFGESIMKNSALGQINTVSSDSVQKCYEGVSGECPNANYFISLAKDYVIPFDRINNTRGVMSPISDGRAEANEYTGTY